VGNVVRHSVRKRRGQYRVYVLVVVVYTTYYVLLATSLDTHHTHTHTSSNSTKVLHVRTFGTLVEAHTLRVFLK